MIKPNFQQFCFPPFWAAGRPLAYFILLLYTFLVLALAACAGEQETDREILVGIEPDSIYLLAEAGDLKPEQTGIASLNALNEKWFILEISPVFPDVSPDDEAARRHGLGGVLKIIVPAKTDIETMLAEYQADPHVAYAEMNKSVEIK